MPPEQIDKKFAQAGWSLDPHVCPDCRAARAKEKAAMASKPAKPTPADMKAQVDMINLLTSHFDVDAGAFIDGYSDARIAHETGLAVDLVTGYRQAAFGELKEPDEVQQLRSDIRALEDLAREQWSGMQTEIASLRGKLATVSQKWGA